MASIDATSSAATATVLTAGLPRAARARAVGVECVGRIAATIEDHSEPGPALLAPRASLVAAIGGMPGDWERRFLATRRFTASRRPRRRDHGILSSMKVQHRLVEILEARLGIDSRYDVRLWLLGEFALRAWRCGARS